MDRAKFFDTVRGGLFAPSLMQSDVDGCNAILDAMDGDPRAFVAYALATAYLETAHTMHPINEMGDDNYFFRMYDMHGNRPGVADMLGNTQPGDGARYHGRGYVQLTGRALYAKAGAAIGVDLIDAPELVLDPANAARIMRGGMDGGWFTGREFATYLPSAGAASRADFIQARHIINGQDRAVDIAIYAIKFQDALA